MHNTKKYFSIILFFSYMNVVFILLVSEIASDALRIYFNCLPRDL